MSDNQNAKRIRALERTIEKLRRELVTDELTGIYNRKGLIKLLTPIINEVNYQLKNPERRKNVIINSLSLVFVDIDHFKKINDTYGHAAGDVVLKAVAEILRIYVRGIDITARWGGEEMVIGLVGANKDDASRVAEHLREKVEGLVIEHEGKQIKVTASFGVAGMKPDMTLEQLLEKADTALYKAKTSGRNKVVTA